MKRKLLGVALIMVVSGFSLADSQAHEDKKITICHIPPGNPENAHTITISVNALPAHMAHGDLIGACNACPPEIPEEDCYCYLNPNDPSCY